MSASFPRAATLLVAASLSTAVVPAFAHHGWSDYDAERTLTLKGRVRTSSYENPHATITLDADGKTWTVALAPVSRMEARGASREAVAVGREVTVVGHPSKTHAGEVRAERVLFSDGATDKTVELR
jgi:hypothetical protein